MAIMHINASLNKEILKMLLINLLDLRATPTWARQLWNQRSFFYRPQDSYSLIDQLCLGAEESAQHLVSDRLQSLNSSAEETVASLLETSQLVAWQALEQIHEENTLVASHQPIERKLQEVVEHLVKLGEYLARWRRRLFYKNLRNHVDFITRAIRLEMKELSPPQDRVEKGIDRLEKAHACLENAANALEENDLENAYGFAKQAMSYRRHSLNHQAIEFFLYLLVRFKLAMERLLTRSRMQKPAYRLYLLERCDRALKQTCYLIRLFHQESRLTPSWNKRLEKQVNLQWKQMAKALEHESFCYGQSEVMHWKLWVHASVYRLGLGYSGEFQRLSAVQEAMAWLTRDTKEANAQLRLVVALLLLIDESFEGAELSSEAIDRVRNELETLARIKPALAVAIDRSCQDLCLLYTRQNADSLPVLKASGRLLSIEWSAQGPEVAVSCLQCLEDLYDIWTGSAASLLK